MKQTRLFVKNVIRRWNRNGNYTTLVGLACMRLEDGEEFYVKIEKRDM